MVKRRPGTRLAGPGVPRAGLEAYELGTYCRSRTCILVPSVATTGRKGSLVPRTPTKSFNCSVVSETVSISLRRRQSLGGNGKLFVRCSETECQHIDTNEPPCPLTLQLFEAEIAERMAQRPE